MVRGSTGNRGAGGVLPCAIINAMVQTGHSGGLAGMADEDATGVAKSETEMEMEMET